MATELAQQLSDAPLAAIISTDIATDGTLAGPNLQALRAMAEASRVPVIASGGIGCMADLLSLLALEPLGVSGVVVGRALYDGRVDLAEAITPSLTIGCRIPSSRWPIWPEPAPPPSSLNTPWVMLEKSALC